MLNYETAAAPLSDGCFCDEFVAECGGNFEAGANIDNRYSDDSLRRKESMQGQTRGGEERGRAIVEPDHIVGEKYDAGGIAIAPLHDDTAVMFEHCETFVPGGEKIRSEVRSG